MDMGVGPPLVGLKWVLKGALGCKIILKLSSFKNDIHFFFSFPDPFPVIIWCGLNGSLIPIGAIIILKYPYD